MYGYVCRLALLCAVLVLVIWSAGCSKKLNGVDGLPEPNRQFSQVTGDFPSVAKVILPKGQGLCSGTFISERVVLTASHCTLSNGAYTVVTSFGTFTTSNRQNFGPGVVDDPNDISILYFDRDIASVADGEIMQVGDSTKSGDHVRVIGFGCNDIDTRRGSGVKRTGTNVVFNISDYIELITPSNGTSVRGILGPENRAGSCFGDSGGPVAKTGPDGKLALVGVAHAGGTYQGDLISEYADITRSDNRNFLSEVNRTLQLKIRGF